MQLQRSIARVATSICQTRGGSGRRSRSGQPLKVFERSEEHVVCDPSCLDSGLEAFFQRGC